MGQCTVCVYPRIKKQAESFFQGSSRLRISRAGPLRDTQASRKQHQAFGSPPEYPSLAKKQTKHGSTTSIKLKGEAKWTKRQTHILNLNEIAPRMPADAQIGTQEDSACFAPAVIRDVNNESELRDDSGAACNLGLCRRRKGATLNICILQTSTLPR